jgi:hypothetical protein
LVDVPNEGVLEDPKPGVVLLTPNAVVAEVPKPGADEPNAGVLEAPNKDGDVEPNAGVVVAPKAGVVVVPKAGVVTPNAGVVVVPNVGVVDVPKVLLPNVGCVCWNVLPKGLDWLGDDPKPPKLGFCPNKDPEPKVEDVAPKAGVGDAPKAGELPNGEEDGVPNVGVDCCWPNAAVDVVPNVGVDCCWPKAPVDVVPKSELPVCAPKVVVGLPNGFGAKGLLAAGVAWPNPCWVPNEFWPNGLVDDCPNAAMKIAHMSDETIINQEKQHCEKYTLQADM